MKKAILFLFAICFMACQPKTDKPEKLIAPDKFEDILYDISLFYSIKGLNSYDENSKERTDMLAVLKKHGIDSLTFTENNRYYVKLHDGTYKRMQNSVLERLEKQKAVVDSLYDVSLSQQTKLDDAPALDSIAKLKKK